MIEQVMEWIRDNRFIVLLVLAVILTAAVITIVVVLLKRRKKGKKEQVFEMLEEPPAPSPGQFPPVSQTPPAGGAAFRPSSPYEDDDRTRQLFDYPEMKLKSYVLELYDLNAPGQVYRVNVTDRITIGRRSDCMVCIPNKTMSGLHCEILLRNGKMILRDLDSTNGTYLDASPNRITEAELNSGSVIEMGSAKLQAVLLQTDQ